MHSLSKSTILLWVWYAVCVLGIGAWSGLIFRSYDYYGAAPVNMAAFAIGSAVAAIIGFPVLVIAWSLQRSRVAQESQSENATARYDLLQAKLDALMNVAGLPGAEGSGDSADAVDSRTTADGFMGDREGATVSATSDLEAASVETGRQARSPYEPPHDH